MVSVGRYEHVGYHLVELDVGKIGNDLRSSPFQRCDYILKLLFSAGQLRCFQPLIPSYLLRRKKTGLCELCCLGTSVIGINVPWFS